MQIDEERKRIKKVQETPAERLGGEVSKKGKLVAMQKYLEEMKVWADINDPMVKKRFEDGMGVLHYIPPFTFFSPFSGLRDPSIVCDGKWNEICEELTNYCGANLF